MTLLNGKIESNGISLYSLQRLKVIGKCKTTNIIYSFIFLNSDSDFLCYFNEFGRLEGRLTRNNKGSHFIFFLHHFLPCVYSEQLL